MGVHEEHKSCGCNNCNDCRTSADHFNPNPATTDCPTGQFMVQVDGAPTCTAADHFKSGNKSGVSADKLKGADGKGSGISADKLKGADGKGTGVGADKFNKFEGAEGKKTGKAADKFEHTREGNGKAADKFEHTAEGGCRLVQAADGTQSFTQIEGAPTCTAADHYKSGNKNHGGVRADKLKGADGKGSGISADKLKGADGKGSGVGADKFNKF